MEAKGNLGKYKELLKQEMDECLRQMVAFQEDKLDAMSMGKPKKADEMEASLQRTRERYNELKVEYLTTPLLMTDDSTIP